jgi:tetratricopeptide (TPR) repeat protein
MTATMDPRRWREVRKLLDAALDLEGAPRSAFLATIEDDSLRADVRRLLAAQTRESPLDRPVVQLAAPLLAGGSEPRDWDREQIGRRVGAFVLDDLLGSGGMGTVYRAHRVDGRFEQQVAIKLVLSAHGGLRERFRKEQEILAGLRHPNIAQVIDGGEAEDGVPYLVMEYVEGLAITDFCRLQVPDAEGRLRLLLRVADALAHAHRNLVVHRDIKPSNILVTPQGHPKLLDFGIAKLVGPFSASATAQRIGPMTPAFAAPEQFGGGAITVATDVYQFGVLLFRLIAGRLPYEADPDDNLAWGRAVTEAEPITLRRGLARMAEKGAAAGDAVRSLERGRDLDAIVRRALAKHPSARYGSIDAMAADLKAYLDGQPVQARRGGAAYHFSRFVRRHAVATAVAASAALGLVALTAYALHQAWLAEREAHRARAAVAFVQEVFRATDPMNQRERRASAEDVLNLAATQVQRQFNDYPDLRGSLEALIADSYFSLNAPVRALPLYERAIEDLRALPNPPRLALAGALARGAFAQRRMGAPERSEAWAREAEALAQGNEPDDFLIRDVLAELHWLVAREDGNPAIALRYAQKAVQDADRAGGGLRDTIRRSALARYGTALTDLGRYDQAEPAMLEVLELSRRLWGEEHLRTLRARQGVGWLWAANGNAERGLQELIAVGEKLRDRYGEATTDYGNNIYNRANAYVALKRDAEAVAHYREAARIYIAASASATPQVGWALSNAALAQLRLGQYAEALATAREIEAAWKTSIDPEAGIRGELHWTRARANFALGELETARREAARAIELTAKRDPPLADLADMHVLAAQIAQARGDAPAAATHYEEAARIVMELAPQRAAEAKEWRRRGDAL